MLHGFDWIEAPAEGRYYREVNVDEQVQKGQRLAIIKDLYGATVAEMRSPLAGRVLMAMNHGVVNAGEWVFSIGAVERE